MIAVLKLGGGAGNDHTAALRNLADRIHSGERWVLVHGASAAADALAEQIGYPARALITPGGHSSRYTDARTLEIFCMAAASANQQMVAALDALGVRAAGLAGPNVIRAARKTAIRAVRDGRQVLIRDDYTGSITGVDARLLSALLEAGITPVVAPVALGAEGERLNVDGDLAAAAIARALEAETLLILSNVPGLLRDIHDPSSLVRSFYLSELPHYESLAAGRMKKKLLAAERAGAGRFILSDSRITQPVDSALAGAGTHIQTRILNGHFND